MYKAALSGLAQAQHTETTLTPREIPYRESTNEPMGQWP